MTIYNSEGVAIYEAPITKSAVIKSELMGDYYIELSFDAVDPIGVGRGSYILHDGSKFEIMDNSLPEDTNTGGLRYTLRFEAQQSQMKRCKVFWRESDNLEVSFSDTTSISQFGNLIVKNINAFLGGNNWSLGSCPEDNTLKTISFGGDTCWDAVNTIAETFGVEWWTEENSGKVSLCFGKLELGTEVEFKKGDAVSSIPYRKGDSANYGTRFYVFGSTRNLPEDYASTESGGITNHVVEKRLHLPNGQQYIDAKPNLKVEDIVEQVVFFDDIYPTNVDTITSLSYNNDSEAQIVYTVRCENTPFTPSNIIDGVQIQATFTSGSLNGRTFDIEIDRNNFDKNFKIVPEVLDEENGLFLPNASLKPNVGDTFILTGIVLPDGRVKEAEQLLLEAGTEYAQKNSNDTEVYDCPTNAIYCHANDCNYNLGQRVKLIGEKFGSGRSSRIQGYEKLLYDEYQAVYTVGDNSAYSRLGSVEKAVQKSEYSNRVGLEANIIRSKSDNTTPSDYNIYSALATEGIFLSKRKGGIVKGMTDFAAGLKVGGKTIRYDAEKKAWFFDGDFVVTGAITMFGNSEGFKPSTIMDAVQVDDITIGKTAEGVLYAKSGGGSGGSGMSYEEINQIVSNAIQNKADKATTLEGYGIEDAYDKSYIDTLAYKLTTVYNWGDHSKAGYVFKDTKQDISARHNFTNGLQIGGITIRKSQDGTVYIDGNLVIKGAMTMFGTDATIPSSIWASIPFDSTMKWDGSKWSVVGGSGSGSVDDSRVNALISEYLTKNSYATQSWVQGQGYLTQHQSLSHLLSKTDAANTYQTIINSTNKLAYSNISGTPDLSVYFRSSDFTKSNIKSTLGISDWALAATKPSYTAAEVGALATSGNTRTLTSYDNTVLVLKTNGYHSMISLENNYGNAVSVGYYSGLGAMLYNNENFLAVHDDGTPVYNTYPLIHSNNIGSYNAGSATKLQTARTIWGQPFNGEANVGGNLTIGYYAIYLVKGDENYKIGWNSKTELEFTSYYGHVFNAGHKEALRINADGNTTINGILNITSNNTAAIVLTDSSRQESSIAFKGTGGNEWYVGKGVGNINDFFGIYNAYKGNALVIDNNSDVTIYGNLTTTGAITMFSQLSMKNVIDYDGLSLAQLEQIKPVRFTWKDGRDNRIHVGCIADYVRPILPEVVYETANKELTVDYGSAAFYIGTSLIKPVVELWEVKDNHEKRIAELERENKRKDEIIISLQNQLKQLIA